MNQLEDKALSLCILTPRISKVSGAYLYQATLHLNPYTYINPTSHTPRHLPTEAQQGISPVRLICMHSKKTLALSQAVRPSYETISPTNQPLRILHNRKRHTLLKPNEDKAPVFFFFCSSEGPHAHKPSKCRVGVDRQLATNEPRWPCHATPLLHI